MVRLTALIITALFLTLLAFHAPQQFGAPKTLEERIAEVQADYLTNNGKYTRLIPNLPENCVVNEYMAPEGPGYQLVCTTSNGTTAIGFGPHAAERTYTITNVASSTP